MTFLREFKGCLIVLFLFFLMLSFGGCAHYTLVDVNEEIAVGSSFKVHSPVKWSKAKVYGVETWTIDGPQLQRLMFFTGVETGKPLFVVQGKKAKNFPAFDHSMTSVEIMELVEATFARINVHDIEMKDLRPVLFCGQDGFRFELHYKIQSGLKYRGFFVGTKKDDKLWAIIYLGTDLYHYKKALKHVEEIVSSAAFL